METKNLQFKDVLVFTSPSRIDWRKTRAKIAMWFITNYPEMNSPTRLFNIFEATDNIQKIIKKQGTKHTYDFMHKGCHYSIKQGD